MRTRTCQSFVHHAEHQSTTPYQVARISEGVAGKDAAAQTSARSGQSTSICEPRRGTNRSRRRKVGTAGHRCLTGTTKEACAAVYVRFAPWFAGRDKCNDLHLILWLIALAYHTHSSFCRQWFPTLSKVGICTAIAISQAQKILQSRKDKADLKSRDAESAKVKPPFYFISYNVKAISAQFIAKRPPALLLGSIIMIVSLCSL